MKRLLIGLITGVALMQCVYRGVPAATMLGLFAILAAFAWVGYELGRSNHD